LPGACHRDTLPATPAFRNATELPMAVLGIVTPGQAPRADIVAQFAAHLPEGTRIQLRGCMDGLTKGDIAGLAPQNGEDVIYSKFADGSDINLAKKHIIARAPAALELLRKDGVDAILFACTGKFPDSLGGADVVFPARVLSALANGLLPSGRLGLLVPLPAQVTQLPAKWARPGLEVVAEALVPSSDEAATEIAARKMAAHKPDLVVMDCMSYAERHKQVVRRVVGKPTLLAATTIARILRELTS
jgi:protein AroM